MRRVGLAAIALLAVTAPPAYGQPDTPTWKAAVSAALAFGRAEGKLTALERFAMPTSPPSRKMADAALDGLDNLAMETRKAFEEVQRHGSPYWTIVAETRIGDVYACQGVKIVAMPLPAGSLQQVSAAQRQAILAGLIQPLQGQAFIHWQRASSQADRSGIAAPWFLFLRRSGC